jgi:predicted DsbA family dithiol-disulfide isomerase
MPTNLPAGISVTVEEFGDYQCPPCGLLHPELKKIAAEYGNKVVIVFRNFPLTMNHKNALPAAQAAEAARLQGHFDEMHDRIYEHQGEWKDLEDPRPIFAKYAKEIGLDLKRYAREIDGSKSSREIESDGQTELVGGWTDAHGLYRRQSVEARGHQSRRSAQRYRHHAHPQGRQTIIDPGRWFRLSKTN